eukprot:TRINITY_DN2061_c0_g2_i1.p1 TRINITY_DN2061_c0_g2~~TRINITY_DN2061_c0_g2_i1.p1  ORF type:complete len:297 (+),score=80.71 TRINITY_DN2061_c0_g2_i1:45-935(+)
MSQEELKELKSEVAELRAALEQTNLQLEKERQARMGLESFVTKLHVQLYDLTQGAALTATMASRTGKETTNANTTLSNASSSSNTPSNASSNANTNTNVSQAIATATATATSNTTASEGSVEHNVIQSSSTTLSKLFSFSEAPSDLNRIEDVLEERFLQLQSSVQTLQDHFSKASSQKEMATFGDDSRNRRIAQLVRGELCTSLIHIMYHGFITTKLIGRYHIWDFYERAADEFGRSENAVLQTIASGVSVVNVYEKMRKNPDMKIRSLICYALNYHQLHEWMACMHPGSPQVARW